MWLKTQKILLQLEQNLASARFNKEAWKNITSFNWGPFTDSDLKRKFRLLSVLGTSALPEDKLTDVSLVTLQIVPNSS